MGINNKIIIIRRVRKKIIGEPAEKKPEKLKYYHMIEEYGIAFYVKKYLWERGGSCREKIKRTIKEYGISY